MNLKDILVHIDNRPTNLTRLDVAMRIAKRHKAKLTGIYVIPSHRLVAKDKMSKRADAAIQDFKERTEGADVSSKVISVDCNTTGLDIPQAINIYAHYHDLLILSQTDYANPDHDIPNNLPELAILGSGRPVLLVPYAGTFDQPFERILFAWRGGPESTRALHDAMPILRKGSEIKVITICGREGDEDYLSHEANICDHMVSYDLNLSCETQLVEDLSVGDLLLNRCAEFSADLLIMGATSQSRRGHQTLGPTGRHLLKLMTLPVLMSH